MNQQSLLATCRLIKSDMLARCNYESKPFTKLQMLKFLVNPEILSSSIYRWQIFFYQHGLSIVASFLKIINSMIFTVNIDSRTQIDAGLLILHASFICIGRHVRIGKNCILVHQNIIAPSPFYSAKTPNSAMGPTIGDDLLLGGGAGIFGDIVLGNQVKVSMNALVEASFGDHAVLFGVPARNVAKAEPNSAEQNEGA